MERLRKQIDRWQRDYAEAQREWIAASEVLDRVDRGLAPYPKAVSEERSTGW